MSLLDIGSAGNNVTKIPIERSNGSAAMVTKIPIERVDKGIKSQSKSLFQTSLLCGCVRHASVFHRISKLYQWDAKARTKILRLQKIYSRHAKIFASSCKSHFLQPTVTILTLQFFPFSNKELFKLTIGSRVWKESEIP